MDKISATDLLDTLRNLNGELALSDVREEGVYARGHILLASSLPLGRLELAAPKLVPRRSTPIIVCDDDDGLSQTAQSRLRALGYEDVSILDGGLSAWVKADNEIFAGHNAPSKALGVFAAKELSIPEIGADELAGLQAKGGDIRVVDCRPFVEYQSGSVPGALNAPGIELLRLLAGGSLDSHLVVTCAGRTRGLLGAQTLIDAGVTGRITALHKGTMGWELSGRALEKKAGRKLDSHLAGDISPADIARSMRLRGKIPVLDENALTRWLKDEDRTTYLFDIRTREEFEAGHFPDARHVVGGQLVQNFDQHVATHGARIVLSDDDGLRASGTALWLRRMGWSDVAIAPITGHSALEAGGERSLSAPLLKDTRYIEADAPDEIVLKPSELSEGREQAMRDYFSGLDDLLEKIERDGSLRLIALPMH